MLKKLFSRFKLFRSCFKAFKGATLATVIFDEIFNVEKVRHIKINGFEVHARTSTPDLRVVINSFYDKEYDDIRCSEPKVIIDAGANIGTSSIFFAEKYPQAQIISIEPEESNYELLVENTKNYENIVTVKAALWGSYDERVIQNRLTGHWGYTVSETMNESITIGQKIKCVTLEWIMDEYNIEKIDLLKMDIEGGEKDVLENSEGWINAVKIMTVELHDRITMGCSRAFYLATKDFETFEMGREKVTAYRA